VRTAAATTLSAAAILWLLAAAPPAESQPAAKATVTTAVLPLYGSGWGEPVYTAAAGKALEERVARLEAGAGVGPAARPRRGTETLKVLAAKCSACHVPSQRDDMKASGGFVLFATDAAESWSPLTDAQESAVKKLVASGDMPKRGPKLTADEKRTVLEWR